MKSLRIRTTASYHPQPVWCHHCCIRIAPYDMRTVYHGKDYHRDCHAKVLNANRKAVKN